MEFLAGRTNIVPLPYWKQHGGYWGDTSKPVSYPSEEEGLRLLAIEDPAETYVNTIFRHSVYQSCLPNSGNILYTHITPPPRLQNFAISFPNLSVYGLDINGWVVGANWMASDYFDCPNLMDIVHADANDTPYDDDSFDAATNYEGIICYATFAEYVRLVRTGGHITTISRNGGGYAHDAVIFFANQASSHAMPYLYQYVEDGNYYIFNITVNDILKHQCRVDAAILDHLHGKLQDRSISSSFDDLLSLGLRPEDIVPSLNRIEQIALHGGGAAGNLYLRN